VDLLRFLVVIPVTTTSSRVLLEFRRMLIFLSLPTVTDFDSNPTKLKTKTSPTFAVIE